MYWIQQYQAKTEPVLVEAEAITESRWHQPWSEPVRYAIAPLLAIALIASGPVFPVQQQGEEITSDKWFAWLSEPVREKPGLRASLQQSFTIDPVAFTLPESAIPIDRWLIALAEPIRLDLRINLRASLQQAATIDPYALTQAESVTEDRWHQPWSEPVVKAKIGLISAAQEDLAITIAEFGEQIGYDKWGYQWSEPIRLDLRIHLMTAAQQPLAPSPEPIPINPRFYGYLIA